MGLRRLGRTQDPTILVLTSLTGGPKHGYSLIQDIQSMSGVNMGPGTLYGVLARLEEEGLVEALPVEERRQPYRLTSLGAATFVNDSRPSQTSLGSASPGWGPEDGDEGRSGQHGIRSCIRLGGVIGISKKHRQILTI